MENDSSPIPRWIDWAAALVAYLVAGAALAWPILRDISGCSSLFQGDTALNAYIMAWGRHALFSDPLALFDANFFHPLKGSITLSENLFSIAFLSTPLFWIKNPLVIYNIWLALSFPLNAFVWFAALRRWGLRSPAAWAGGFAFGFLPWRYGQVGHAQTLFTWWFPVAALGIEAWTRRGSWRGAILAGFAVGASIYTCVYHAIFLALFGAAFALAGYLTIASSQRLGRRIALLGALAGAILVAMALPAAPSYVEMRRVLGQFNTLEELVPRGACFSDYLRGGESLAWSGGARRRLGPNPYSDIPWEHDLFLGLAPLLLAATLPLALRLCPEWSEGAEKARMKRLGWMLAAGGAWLFLVSMGPELYFNGKPTGIPMPYRALHEWLPGMGSLRVPTRAAAVVGFAASGLAALAIHAWASAAAEKRRWLGATVGLAGATLVAAELWPMPLPTNVNPVFNRLLNVQREVARRPKGVVLVLPLDPDLNYIAPLSTWPHFYPTVNGLSGYMPGSNGEIFRALGQAEWGEEEAKLLRWLDVRYIIIDPANAQSPPTASLEALPARLESLGFAVEATPFPEEKMTLLTIRAAAAPLPSAPSPKLDFDVSHFIEKKGRETRVSLWLAARDGPRFLPAESRWIDIVVRAYDADGDRIWKLETRRRLPQFILRGQGVGIAFPIPRAVAERTTRIQSNLEDLPLLFKARHEIELKPPPAR